MTNRKIYLRSFDKHAEILEIDADQGKVRVIERTAFEPLGVPRNFGAFTREGADVYGVFASPQGPVFFKNSITALGRFNRVRAELHLDERSRLQRFELWDGDVLVFSALYKERQGIGANPYDTAREDVDLFALMAAGVKKPQFFENYTRA